MATLVSPGVSVTLVNESFYATAGTGTVPLVVIATAQNKFQPGSSTALASGTVKENAGRLYLVTSQRDALQTFGTPNFYTVAGTPQYDNELNELGLFALYDYLGIANSAYVIRADVDLAQLAPSATSPTGTASNGDYWFDLNNTSWGVFKSNGDANSAYAWQAKTPLVIKNKSDLEVVIQGNTTSTASPVVSPTASVISSNGVLVINGVSISLISGSSITDVANKINSTAALIRMGISASIFARRGKFYSNGTSIDGMFYGDIYNIRIACNDVDKELILSDSASSVLDDLGFDDTTPTNVVLPKASFGSDDDFAIDVVSVNAATNNRHNSLWQKISVVTTGGTKAWWFKVGSTDANYPGWGWREAMPTTVTGSRANPTFVAEESFSVMIGSTNVGTVTVPGTAPDVVSLDSLIAEINSAFNTANVMAVAKKNMLGNNSYLQIINYDGTDIWLNDQSATATPMQDAGISIAQTFFGSVTGTVSDPTFVVGDKLIINFGGSDVTVTISSSDPTASLDDIIASINNAPEFAAFVAGGQNIASKSTVGTSNYLVITNPNGTNFTLKDAQGTPFKTAGIPAGYTFGKQLVYKGYSPSLTVPSTAAELASENVWINTTSQNRGASIIVRQYQNGTWVTMNDRPNTGTVPMYRDTTSADSGFGSAKTIGTIFMMYNAAGENPAEADHVLMIWDGTAWNPLEYTPDTVTPSGPPAAGTYWYNTDLRVDLMVSTGQVWMGYRNMYPATDPNGAIISASKPITQSDNTPLVDYDIWIDSSDMENYPRIYRYNTATRSWILVDNTDHSSSAGVIFADARATADLLENGSTAPASMVISNSTDPDAPDAELYPRGLLLFNTRYSTNNVKVWTPNAVPTAVYTDRWVTASGNKPDGTPYMGHWAQRNIVVQALKTVIQSNQDARAEQTFFNLLATPGYTECLSDMVELNTDKKEIAFIVGDTPSRLLPDGTSIQTWASNSNNVPMDGPDGLVTRNDYVGLYYPWALSTNIDGSSVFVPPSAMALRTYAYNDQVAYPWFAPAGFNRGLVTGVGSVGYLTAQNTYLPVQLSQGQRDVLYTNSINPIAYIPNRGLVVYGQKTLSPVASAMDRVNVARLMNYLKYQLDNLAKPFLFEPNDKQTRQAVTTTFNGFMGNLVGLRALYDFSVLCDETNNTPARIDRNELWIDVAIKPEKAIEFIYIPIRLLNTGDPLPNSNRG